MKGIWQLISHENGSRSDAVQCTAQQLMEMISKLENVKDEDYILLIVQIDDDDEINDMISVAPLTTVGTMKQLNEIEWADDEGTNSSATG